MSAASLIANHMNAPYGKIVSEEDIVASFENGKLSASNESADGILGPLFNEKEPSLISRCERELGVTLQTVNDLYGDVLKKGFCSSPALENAVNPRA